MRLQKFENRVHDTQLTMSCYDEWLHACVGPQPVKESNHIPCGISHNESWTWTMDKGLLNCIPMVDKLVNSGIIGANMCFAKLPQPIRGGIRWRGKDLFGWLPL